MAVDKEKTGWVREPGSVHLVKESRGTHLRGSASLNGSLRLLPALCLIICHPLFLLPPIPPNIRVFSNELTLRMRWPKYQNIRLLHMMWPNISFSIIPSNEHPGLISFRTDWQDLLAVQGTLNPGKNRGVGCHFLLQGIFPTQESNPHLLCLLHWQAGSLPLRHLGRKDWRNESFTIRN